MRVELHNIKAGDNILWKKNGLFSDILSFVIGLTDGKWRKRDWQPWHTGYCVKVLDTGEIVTSQAVAGGVEVVTYASWQDLGDCRVYRWLDNPDQFDIEWYTAEHEGEPYDIRAYVWTIAGELSRIIFRWPFRVVNKAKMCWENLSEFNRAMGKELQPESEPCMINRILDKLEGHQCRTEKTC